VNPFYLNFKIPESKLKIQHGDQILFLGSCFSDEIAQKAKYAGLKVSSNPFGTIYHPLLLSQFIAETIKSDSTVERIVQRNDLYFSWDANSSVYGYEKTELELKLKNIRHDWVEKLKTVKFLFVTFGTAWGYFEMESSELVGNCLKFPSTKFKKELAEIEIIVEAWNRNLKILKEINPEINVVFTVSPVRHVKDGLIENNRSKSILIESVRQLVNKNECLYFPSYEIIIDELRDYRFFKEDRIHPTEEAVNYVWQKFSNVFFNSKTQEINREVEKLKLAEAHRTFFSESIEAQEHIHRTRLLRENLFKEFPEIILD